MRRIAKGLAWALAGVVVAIAAERPGLSQELQLLTETSGVSEEPWELNTLQMTLFGPALSEPEQMTPSRLATKAQELAQADPRQAEADRLLDQGVQQYRVSQFREAIASWQQALELYRETGDRVEEGSALSS
ncbi:MAG: hypothetical protein AAF773_06165, partial [Cyanobacteria bacterium P01_D01_bin.115]